MDYFKLDGKSYDVLVIAIEESFNILYSENTGRTMSPTAKMILDPIGTFYTHRVTVRKRKGFEKEYDELYDYISTPRYDGIHVEIAHNQTTTEYDAYISNGTRPVKSIDAKAGITHWGDLTINIIPMEAKEIPNERKD